MQPIRSRYLNVLAIDSFINPESARAALFTSLILCDTANNNALTLLSESLTDPIAPSSIALLNSA